ncbi:MAG TPA: hypothetical protein VMR97_04605 [Acidimicrobiales bacterium]|nr:hypothetical protein [Acidimicrobiales bacterium]
MPPPTTQGTYAVGTAALNVVEPGATSGAADRMLPIAVWYPAVSSNGTVSPDNARAPYPLLVFSQGYDASVSTYSVLLEDWASAGFVVAAPTYPHTDPSAPAALDESDIVNHPADLRYVISTILDTSEAQGSPLTGLVNTGEIGLVGQSDGADVSLAVADDSCCQDPRVKAAAILSGAEESDFGGSYFTTGEHYVPLLVVQGEDDTINVPVCSAQLYDGASSPKYYLDLLGAGHLPPYVDPGTDQQVIVRVVIDFFDAQLAGQQAGATAIASDGNVSGATQITVSASAPTEPGSCPGAPG